jgi:hypothetical protein
MFQFVSDVIIDLSGPLSLPAFHVYYRDLFVRDVTNYFGFDYSRALPLNIMAACHTKDT